MSLMNDVFNLETLDLLTQEEKDFNKIHVDKMKAFAGGNVTGMEIKHLTAGAAVVAKRQQSRSSVATLKWNIMQTESKQNKGNK